MNCDYEILAQKNYIFERDIIIYGAGMFGRKALSFLQDLGIKPRAFCDSYKDGGMIHDIPVCSSFILKDIQKETIVIVAINDAKEAEWISSALTFIKNIRICSYGALERFWAIYCCDVEDTYIKLNEVKRWYEMQALRTAQAMEAVKEDILIWQSGKVGSEALRDTLRKHNISCAHVHRFIFNNDILAEALLDNRMEGDRKLGTFSVRKGIIEDIKYSIRGKKIMTMIRNPIDTNLSHAFQLFGLGLLDGYLRRKCNEGFSFLEALTSFVEKNKSRLFDWYEQELFALTGINVLDYQFDIEKGYGIINSENNDILIMRTEKMDSLCSEINGFLDTDIKEIEHTNVGEDKWYKHIYSHTKKNIIYSNEYISYYNEKNPYIKHFFGEIY